MISTFVTSSLNKAGWPESELPEVVVVGRSNVGKSSFINALTGKKKLAYVGSTPGKTRMINFFDIDSSWMLVDVPGYGYAKMSKEMIVKMGNMMDEYFNERNQISCVIQLVDARHEPTRDDKEMIAMMRELNHPIVIVATKVDKIPKTKRIKALKEISQSLQIPLKNIYGVSSTERIGFEEVLGKIQEYI